MESVEKDHVRDGVHETPTVCGTPGTPHDMDVDTDGEVDMPSSLHNRAPSTQRVINEIKMLDDIQTPIRHSPIFDEGNQHILFQLSFWNEINSKLIRTPPFSLKSPSWNGPSLLRSTGPSNPSVFLFSSLTPNLPITNNFMLAVTEGNLEDDEGKLPHNNQTAGTRGRGGGGGCFQ